MSICNNPESTPKKVYPTHPPIYTSDFSLYSSSDTEYHLCHSFMRITGDQLIRKQLLMMMETNKLMDSLHTKVSSSNFEVSSEFSSEDQTLSTCSKTLESSAIKTDYNNSSFISKPRKAFCRKNSSSGTNRSINTNALSHALEDIKQNCSRATFNQINNLVTEFNSLQSSKAQQQTRQKPATFTRTQNSIKNTNEQFEQIILLTAKITKLEKENLSFRDKVQELEGKIKMNRSYLEEKAGSFNKSALVSRKIGNNENINIEEVKKYLQQKGTLLRKKQQELQDISDCIMKCLQEKLIDKGCQKCCTMMQKLKQSLLRYRKFLQDQYTQQQDLTRKYILRIGKNRSVSKKKENKI